MVRILKFIVYYVSVWGKEYREELILIITVFFVSGCFGR